MKLPVLIKLSCLSVHYIVTSYTELIAILLELIKVNEPDASKIIMYRVPHNCKHTLVLSP